MNGLGLICHSQMGGVLQAAEERLQIHPQTSITEPSCLLDLLVRADPPSLPSAGVALRSHQYPGVYATMLLYWRLSKPRVRQEDSNQSDIHLFFFWFSWYILARLHMYINMAVYKLSNKKKKLCIIRKWWRLCMPWKLGIIIWKDINTRLRSGQIIEILSTLYQQKNWIIIKHAGPCIYHILISTLSSRLGHLWSKPMPCQDAQTLKRR